MYMSTTTPRRHYAKRYIRRDNPPNFELTERAIRINTEVCRRPLIRKDQLRNLFPEISDRPFDQIISNLFHNGFIARPRQQQELHNQVNGSLPTYLTPDRRGVHLHSAFFTDPVATPKYSQDNNRMTWGYMRHQHTTTTTLINYQTGAQTVPNFSFLSEPDLWNRYAPNNVINQPTLRLEDTRKLMAHDFIANPPEVRGRSAKIPLQLSAHLEWPVHIPGQAGLSTTPIYARTQPDGYFAQHHARTDFFFLESDEGTETILPGKSTRHSMQLFYDTSLFAKYLVYIAAFRKRAHVKQFGIPSFQVITVTTTPRRVSQIIDKLHAILTRDPLHIHPNFFLFTDRNTLTQYDNNPYHPDHHHKNLAGDDVQLHSASSSSA
ncbi:MAG: hypothetical protein APF80_13410 [Alphaproteobacteria bacterium BRH_c36]|nr:MAG: hypothetical protein APF80_13410 [Alphaproteobacteria bacterium BRH_c36]